MVTKHWLVDKYSCSVSSEQTVNLIILILKVYSANQIWEAYSFNVKKVYLQQLN